ncbi:hypothetical protein MtrunA17_Chr2g0324031 [Medicago truncatula]|uniref:Transmembrane protein n=1 Tax=Medicago truncatula TaxID=3880 RepID=A0A396JH49_MEDTR|nr:hypothetical protein MtrunA17_Chr2g0324031 [Medicago truncatula]
MYIIGLELLGYFLSMAKTVLHFFILALSPFQQWWVVPIKVAFDQTVWSTICNTIYFVVWVCCVSTLWNTNYLILGYV